MGVLIVTCQCGHTDRITSFFGEPPSPENIKAIHAYALGQPCRQCRDADIEMRKYRMWLEIETARGRRDA